MNRPLLEARRARLEEGRAGVAKAFRAASLGPTAVALEGLPLAGTDGWEDAWIASLRLAQAAARRWAATVAEFERRAATAETREGWARLARQLGTAAHAAFTLLRTVALPSGASSRVPRPGPPQ